MYKPHKKKRCSRQPISPDTKAQIERLHQEGISINQISQRLNIAYGMAWNYVQTVESP
jgi:molybdenum-dependent DNA-binding transcriptional regulator ModE